MGREIRRVPKDWKHPEQKNGNFKPLFGDQMQCKREDSTCYQIYETVTNGTPVSPVFETKEEMIEWMVSPIDMKSRYTYLSSNDGHVTSMQGATREVAEAFVKSEWAPSIVINNGVLKRNAAGLVDELI